ncbi:MAG: hypothetical protein IPL01_05505 [Acidobacteria bacterium]|nr:hypothetical protein [Acidobacteriota bacterium]
MNRAAQGSDLIGGQRLRALQLVKICFGYDQLGRPYVLLLVLDVEFSHLHRFRGVNFILGQ